MTIHFTLSPSIIEFACHAVAAMFYFFAGGIFISDKPRGYCTGLVVFVLIIAIILTVIGAHQ